jgi:hypothetical protein
MIAVAFVLLSGAAGGWITLLPPGRLYVVAALLSVTGLVLQDVVADAMSTEVVARTNPDGTPRPKAEIDHDLGMVQVLGRLALSFGIFAVAGVSGWLAQWLSYQTVFLLGLIVPVISISGALLVRLETSERRPTDWRILGGGLVFGADLRNLAVNLRICPARAICRNVQSSISDSTWRCRSRIGICLAQPSRPFHAIPPTGSGRIASGIVPKRLAIGFH